MGKRFFFFLALLLCCSVSMAEEAVEIPLNEIWAFEMPGTKGISELSSQATGFGEVMRLLRKPAPKGDSVRPAFAVQGTGLEALRNSYEVLVKQKDPKRSFDADADISIVFFSHDDNHYVHLESVERKDKTITINYKFISHEEQETTSHFALIPLGKLPVGKYQVDVVPNQVNTADEPTFRPVDDEIINRIVSGSFSFTLKEGK